MYQNTCLKESQLLLIKVWEAPLGSKLLTLRENPTPDKYRFYFYRSERPLWGKNFLSGCAESKVYFYRSERPLWGKNFWPSDSLWVCQTFWTSKKLVLWILTLFEIWKTQKKSRNHVFFMNAPISVDFHKNQRKSTPVGGICKISIFWTKTIGSTLLFFSKIGRFDTFWKLKNRSKTQRESKAWLIPEATLGPNL